MYDDVLLPTDGSSGTVEALEHALAIAENEGATVHVLYVVDSRHYRAASEDAKDEVRRSLVEEGERALEDAEVRLTDEGLEVRTTCREGIPHKTILAYADTEGIDLVVMGTHGKTGRERLATLGSTTERVVKNGEVPVLVVDIG